WPAPTAVSWCGSAHGLRATLHFDRHLSKVALLAAVHASHELATRGVDVVPTGTPHRGAQAAIVQDILKTLYTVVVRPCIWRTGMRIERNQVDLGRALPQQLDQLTCLFGIIIDPCEQHVFI